MKKYFYVAALFLAAVSCNKESLEVSPAVPATEPMMELSLPASKASCKTTLATDGSGVVYWSEGDALSVFDLSGECAGHRFDGVISTDPTLAEFSGEVHLDTKQIYALYPFDGAASLAGTALTTTLPASQDATSSSFAKGAALALASGAVANHTVEDGLVFEPLCAMVSFKMPSYVDGAQSVEISAANGASIAGTVTVDLESAAITSVSGSSSVVVAVNSLGAGQTYLAAVAPGSYPGGFTFRVTTAAGNVYTARNPKDMVLEAGGVYPLGTPGLVLDNSVIVPHVTISHTYASGELTGSNASLSISGIPAELSDMISAWSVELRRNGQTVRRLSASSGTMAVAGGWTYLPKGEYDVVASYTSASGAVKQLTAKASSPAPSVSVTLGGYTSYDCYAGTNGQKKSASTANSKDGSTVYAPSMKVGVATALLQDSKYGSSSWSYSYDGGPATGFDGNYFSYDTLPGQSLGRHTLDATCTFDGVTASAPQRVFHITGLPYSLDPADWSRSNNSAIVNGNQIQLGNNGTGAATAQMNLYSPANIDVRVSTNVDIRRTTKTLQTTYEVKVSGTQIISQQNPENRSTNNYTCTADGTMTSSAPQFYLESTYRMKGAGYLVVKTFNITYK